MGTDYLPPEGTKLPFNFTEAGYAPPNSISILFNFAPQGNFGTLKAAINVMQPYWETTHTYPKSCPKYVVGYGPGGVQIIKGRCLYGGIRDLQGLITGVPKGLATGPLSASINAILNKGQSNLTAEMRVIRGIDLGGSIDTHQPKDISATLEGIKFKGTGDLDAFLGTHSPRDIQAYIGAHTPGELPATLIGEKWHGTGDILSEIKTHPPRNLPAAIGGHRAGNLGVILRAWSYETPLDFPGLIHGWQKSPDLGASVNYHFPQNLFGLIRGWAREVPTDLSAFLRGYTTRDLPAIIDTHIYDQLRFSIRAWHRGVQGDLPTTIRMWQQEELTGQIGTHPWALLGAKVLPHPPPPITASIRGWIREAISNLTGNIYGWQAGDLGAFAGGHLSGNLGIILRGWHYEDTRDMPARIHGWQELDLSAYANPHVFGNLGIILKGVVLGQPADLPANLYGWQEGDLGTITKGGHAPGNMQALIDIWQHESRDLGATFHGWEERFFGSQIDTHLPSNIRGQIRGWKREAYSNLTASTRGWQQGNLGWVTKGGHGPIRLGAIIKVSEKLSELFPAYIHGWEWRNLGMTLAGTHDPVRLDAYLVAQERRESDVLASVFGWATKDLPAYLNIMFKRSLQASLLPVQPEDLSAYVRARYYRDLSAKVQSYDQRYLGAYLKRIYDTILPAQIKPLTDTYANLPVKIYPYGSEQRDLPGYLRAYMWRTLSANLIPKYVADISAYLFAIRPRNLKGIIHGWEERFLQGILTVAKYPWNLTASIYADGTFRNLPSYIYPLRGGGVSDDLKVLIHPWEIRNFSAYIFADRTGNLSAYLEPYMQGSDLHASIRPKMIRLTTTVQIPTLVARDLSATINYLCFQTGFRDLRSLIYAKFKGDLFAFLRARPGYGPGVDLGAKIGYSDSYLELDNYKLSITVLPSKYFVEDIFRFRVNVLKSGDVLSAYIRPTPRYRGLTSAVTGIDIPSFTYSGLFKNREKFIHTTYDGMFETFETVEIAFKSAVKEYFYSSIANKAWKTNRFEKWMLDVRSVLPSELAVKLKRRIHRIATVYDFKKFKSVDEAIRYAINHVTEWPEGNLGATINNRGRYQLLQAYLVPKYVKREQTMMSASRTALQDSIIVAEKSDISKIRK